MTTLQTPIATQERISRADQKKAMSTMTMAFAADPTIRWMYPDATDYMLHFPEFVSAYAGDAFVYETADCIAGHTGAALWFPPEKEPDEEQVMQTLENTIPAELLTEILPVFERLEEYHPDGEHWYLAMLGVEPQHQGRGLGSALLRHGLDRCDRDRLPAYLESSSAVNIPLYERMGFELLGVIQEGNSPEVFPMLRKAKA